MDDLRPCPFCGSGEVKSIASTCGWTVVCNNTSCPVRSGYFNEPAAIKAWNTRYTPLIATITSGVTTPND